MQLLQIDNEIELGFVAQKVNAFLKNGRDTEKNDRHFQAFYVTTTQFLYEGRPERHSR